MEMTVEIFVFLGIGVVLFGIISGLIFFWDLGGQADTIAELYTEGDQKADNRGDRFDFAVQLVDFWNECNHSHSDKAFVMYVYMSDEDYNGNISIEALTDIYKELDWCKDLQSASNSCGRREDINMTTISLPKVIHAQCSNKTLHIE